MLIEIDEHVINKVKDIAKESCDKKTDFDEIDVFIHDLIEVLILRKETLKG